MNGKKRGPWKPPLCRLGLHQWRYKQTMLGSKDSKTYGCLRCGGFRESWK